MADGTATVGGEEVWHGCREGREDGGGGEGREGGGGGEAEEGGGAEEVAELMRRDEAQAQLAAQAIGQLTLGAWPSHGARHETSGTRQAQVGRPLSGTRLAHVWHTSTSIGTSPRQVSGMLQSHSSTLPFAGQKAADALAAADERRAKKMGIVL